MSQSTQYYEFVNRKFVHLLHGHATFKTLVLLERQTVISIPAIFRDLSQNHSRARFLRFVLRIIRIFLKIPTQEATLWVYFPSIVEVLRNTEHEDAQLFRDIAQVFIDAKIEMLISWALSPRSRYNYCYCWPNSCFIRTICQLFFKFLELKVEKLSHPMDYRFATIAKRVWEVNQKGLGLMNSLLGTFEPMTNQ
jgi:hypothetical protein